jgi:hypothetical protein
VVAQHLDELSHQVQDGPVLHSHYFQAFLMATSLQYWLVALVRQDDSLFTAAGTRFSPLFECQLGTVNPTVKTGLVIFETVADYSYGLQVKFQAASKQPPFAHAYHPFQRMLATAAVDRSCYTCIVGLD